jgi:hypothetical protein
MLCRKENFLLPQIAFISLKNDRFLRVNRGEKGILRT